MVLFPRYGMIFVLVCSLSSYAHAALNIPITVNLSEVVTVTGGPQILVDVGGVSRTATYSSGSGSNTLTFTLTPQAGDIDLDGITVLSPVQLNGGTIKDSKGNDATLTFMPPNTTNVKVNYPSLGMDFTYDADGRYTLNGTVYNDLSSFLVASGGTFSRASIGTYFDASGALQTASSGVARFDYHPVTHAARGILIEESRKNSLRNSTMQGVVAGTPGTFPTNWAPGGVGLGALTQQIIGTGTENGMSYVDIRLSGTASTATYVIYMDNTGYIAATSGQVWTSSVYTKLIAGTTNNVSARLDIYERNSSGTAIINSQTNLSTTGTLTRTTLTRTLNNASTAYVISDVSFYFTIGQPVDITLRIAAPQIEQGAFATSFIPTTNAPVIRGTDTFTVPTGGWFNGGEGTLFAQSVLPYLGGTTYPGIAGLDDGGANNAVEFVINDASNDYSSANYYVGGIFIANVASSSVYTENSTLKISAAYKNNDSRGSINGNIGSQVNPIAIPTFTTLRVGARRGNSGPLNGWIQKEKYYPARVSNAQLQLLTQ